MRVTPSLYRAAVSVVTVCMSISMTVPAYAANLYYTGGGGPATTRDIWEAPTNWSTIPRGRGDGTVPGVGDIAILGQSGATVRLRSNARVGGIILTNSWTGSLLTATGTLRAGSTGIRIGSGRLIGGVGAISSSGSYTQTGGLVSAIQSTLTLSGSFSITRGVATNTPSFSSTGTLVFDGPTTQTLTQGANALIALKGLSLQNVGSAGSNKLTTSMNGGLNLSGALTITTGQLDLSTNNTNLVVEGATSIAASALASLTSDGNITASGSISTGAGGTFTMSGTNTLTLNGFYQTLDTNGASLYNLTVASSSGTDLASNQIVTNTLQVNTGAILRLQSFTMSATGTTLLNYGLIFEQTGKIYHTATGLAVAGSNYVETGSVVMGTYAYFTINESDANLSGVAADTLRVIMTDATGDSETGTLVETSNTSGIFRGALFTRNTAITRNDGSIESLTATTITATYTDAQDGLSNTDSANLVLASSSGNGSATVTTTSGGGGGGGGGGGHHSTTVVVTTPTGTTTVVVTPTPKEPGVTKQFVDRTCSRVLHWFAGNSKMMGRVNDRLQKRFGFMCH